MDRSSTLDHMNRYLIQLVGKPYKFWEGEDIRQDGAPFWVGHGIVDPQIVSSISCTGLLNLVYRYLEKKIPDIDNNTCFFPGGTRSWFVALYTKYGYQIYQPYNRYPIGTLLIRSYREYKDQGHVAIIFNENQDTIHSRPSDMVILRGVVGPGVVVEPPSIMNRFTNKCFYEYFYTFDQWTDL